jgi:hypothetical protein
MGVSPNSIPEILILLPNVIVARLRLVTRPPPTFPVTSRWGPLLFPLVPFFRIPACVHLTARAWCKIILDLGLICLEIHTVGAWQVFWSSLCPSKVAYTQPTSSGLCIIRLPVFSIRHPPHFNLFHPLSHPHISCAHLPHSAPIRTHHG